MDSDGFFLRPFSAADLYLDGRPRLYVRRRAISAICCNDPATA